MEESGKKKTRGLKWTDLETKQMLKVAIKLNVNKLFDSNKLSSNEIYGKIASRFRPKDPNQIRLKFEALRRNFRAEKAVKDEIGAVPQFKTIYNPEMELLWDKRKKIRQENGMDVASLHIKPDILSDASSDDDSSNTIKTTNKIPSSSTEAVSPLKKSKKCDVTDVLAKEFREDQHKMMEGFERMHREAEDRSDRRCKLFLNELKAIREAMAAISSQQSAHSRSPEFVQPPSRSPSVDANSKTSSIYELPSDAVTDDEENPN